MHRNAKCTRKEPGQKQGTNTINESDEYEGDSRERKKFIDKTTRRLQIETQKNKEHAVSKNSTSTPRIVNATRLLKLQKMQILPLEQPGYTLFLPKVFFKVDVPDCEVVEESKRVITHLHQAARKGELLSSIAAAWRAPKPSRLPQATVGEDALARI